MSMKLQLLVTSYTLPFKEGDSYAFRSYSC